MAMWFAMPVTTGHVSTQGTCLLRLSVKTFSTWFEKGGGIRQSVIEIQAQNSDQIR
jgi:hypothetical protein